MRNRVRRRGGGSSAGTASDFGNKKTNNALRDKTSPGVDVARCCGKRIGGGTRLPWPTIRNGTDESQNFVQLPVQGKCEPEARFKWR